MPKQRKTKVKTAKQTDRKGKTNGKGNKNGKGKKKVKEVGDKKKVEPKKTIEECKIECKREMEKVGFQAEEFISSMEEGVERRRKQAKAPKQIRYYFYMSWARCLYHAEIGPEQPNYGYPACVLELLRTICPGDIVGEMWETAYKVTMAEFCKALKLPEQNDPNKS